jgi:hypothetical protein
MSLYAEKVKLSQMVLKIESKQLIEKILNLIKNEDVDLWDEINDDIKADVDFAINELDNGGGLQMTRLWKNMRNG